MVERQLPKLHVAGSIPVSRSISSGPASARRRPARPLRPTARPRGLARREAFILADILDLTSSLARPAVFPLPDVPQPAAGGDVRGERGKK